MDRDNLHQSAYVLYLRAPGTAFVRYTETRATDWCGVRSGKDYNKFEEMRLTPGKSTVVSAPLIEESPLCIECRVKEIVSLGSHDMFIADVVNVRADPLVYVHGGYYELGEKIGKFGWSVEKKK